MLFFVILCVSLLQCQGQIINSNITSFVELNLEIEIKVEEENTTLASPSLAQLSREDNSSSPGVFVLTPLNTTTTDSSTFLIEAVEAEVLDDTETTD